MTWNTKYLIVSIYIYEKVIFIYYLPICSILGIKGRAQNNIIVLALSTNYASSGIMRDACLLFNHGAVLIRNLLFWSLKLIVLTCKT